MIISYIKVSVSKFDFFINFRNRDIKNRFVKPVLEQDYKTTYISNYLITPHAIRAPASPAGSVT